MVLGLLWWVLAWWLVNPAGAQVPEGTPPADEALVVAVSPFAPFASFVGGAEPSGFSVDLWQAVARAEQLDFEFRTYDNVGDKLAAVRSGEADLAIGGISMTLEREEDLDFSQATFRTGLDICVLDEQASPFSMQALGKVFTPSRMGIVLGFFALIVVSGHLVWAAERGKDSFDDKYIPGVFEGMYWAIVTASTVGYGDKAPVQWAGRLVAALVIVVSLPMFAVFTAELASTLTVATLELQIQGAEDLRGRRVGVVEGTTGERSMKRVGANVVPFANTADAVDALGRREVSAVVHDAPNLYALVNAAPRSDLMLVGNLFEPQQYGFVVAQQSDLREVLNRGLLEVRESGEWDTIRSRWFDGDLGR